MRLGEHWVVNRYLVQGNDEIWPHFTSFVARAIEV